MSLATALVDLIYPPSCAACGELGREPFCSICGDALLPARPFEIPGADGAMAVFDFGGPIADAIHRLKYRGRPDLGRVLGAFMRPAAIALEVDAAVPIPITWRKARERTYNQAFELARHVGVRMRPRALARRVERRQVGASRRQRAGNLHGAFAPGPDRVEGLRVLLVDDVVTTGATAAAAVSVLKARGAAEVMVLALAHKG
jgi:ComF family protein